MNEVPEMLVLSMTCERVLSEQDRPRRTRHEEVAAVLMEASSDSPPPYWKSVILLNRRVLVTILKVLVSMNLP